MLPATAQILAWPYQLEPQKAEGEVERMLGEEMLLRGKPLMIVPTDGVWHWAWDASTPAFLWRNSSDGHSHHVILMLTEESSHQTMQRPWHPSWLIIIQSGKWDWWLRGHWISLQLLTWMATDSLATMASVCKPGYYRRHIYCWTRFICCNVLSKIILIIMDLNSETCTCATPAGTWWLTKQQKQ